MFHEREHSLHHSHEMTEKVGGDGTAPGTFWNISLSLCAALCRRSWTAPVTASSRSPTTATLRKRRDPVQPGEDWGSPVEKPARGSSCRKHGDEGLSFPPSPPHPTGITPLGSHANLESNQGRALLFTNSGGSRLHEHLLAFTAGSSQSV